VGQGEALANHVSCGDTITADTTLDSDLVNCPNNGIVIGAGGITLDLNGHVIDGDGALIDPCPPGEDCDIGIDSGGHDDVTIKDGTVTQFGLGALVFRSRRNRILDITASMNTFSGIIVGRSDQGEVRRSAVRANGLTTDQAGIVLFTSHGNLIRGNALRRNGDIGLFVTDNSARNRFSRNVVTHNPEAGMIIDHDGGRIAHNHLVANGDGIVVTGNRNIIRRNHVRRAKGCDPGCGKGISFEGGHENLIARNWIRKPARSGMFLGGRENVVRRNHVIRAGRDGMLVDRRNDRTILARNHVFAAGNDGIDVENSTATLRRNEARRNGDLGIEAVRGVTDGGGNIARHNGDPRQCTHVVCS
jgi:parallel beta-helix repeat protein